MAAAGPSETQSPLCSGITHGARALIFPPSRPAIGVAPRQCVIAVEACDHTFTTHPLSAELRRFLVRSSEMPISEEDRKDRGRDNAEFCLAPGGQTGGYGSRDVCSARGLAPVISASRCRNCYVASSQGQASD